MLTVMRVITFLILFLCTSVAGFSQVNSTYHVTSTTLNLRSAPNTSGKIIKKLNKHDNVFIFEVLHDVGWVKVQFENDVGYVSKKYIKKGKAIVSFYTYRVGAVCRDGSSSTATGRGACSHHGGVARWKTRKKSKVRIVNQN